MIKLRPKWCLRLKFLKLTSSNIWTDLYKTDAVLLIMEIEGVKLAILEWENMVSKGQNVAYHVSQLENVQTIQIKSIVNYMYQLRNISGWQLVTVLHYKCTLRILIFFFTFSSCALIMGLLSLSHYGAFVAESFIWRARCRFLKSSWLSVSASVVWHCSRFLKI